MQMSTFWRKSVSIALAWGFLTGVSSAPVLVRSISASDGQQQDSRSSEPTAVDLRPKFEALGLQTRVQGNRGTCSVFAMTAAIEYAAAGRADIKPPLSVEYLNWASNAATRDHDDGSFFSDLWTGFAKYGICAEAAMPYQDQFNPATKPASEVVTEAQTLSQLGLQFHWIKEWNPHHGLSAEQLLEVKRTLQKEYPVCGGFLWPKNQVWKDGVLQMCPRRDVRDGHSILIVGYRDDAAQPGGGLFLIRNTSGSSRDGYLTYEYLREYMNDAAWVESPASQDPKSDTPVSVHEASPATSITTTAPAAFVTAADPSAADPSATAPKADVDSLLFRDSLGLLTSPPVGRNRRVSSNEQPKWNDANLDMTWLQPGQVLELPLLQGPGVINHIWFTSHSGWANELNALSMRIYWDGRKEPGVEVPIADFFAVGQGKPASVESVPVQVSPTGSLTCYWRMPFAKSAKIVITNDNPDRGTGLYWQVDWVALESLPPETPYFHAQYRQEYPAKPGDYLIADLTGQGHFVGTVMSVTMAQDGWFGEGDDFFYIDGETVPSLQGTGTEDYFNDAWGYRSRTGPWFGQPRWQGDRAGDSGVCYRWHVLDPVGFKSSLRFTIEHKGNYDDDTAGFYVERPEFLSSVAFWYQTGEPKRFAKLPPWSERRIPWQHQHLVKTFLKAETSGAAKVAVQTQGFFGARPLLSWPNQELDAKLTLPFEVTESGSYVVRLTALQGPQYGKYAILIDDQRMGEANFGAAVEEELDLRVCACDLSAGAHKLTLQALDTANPGEPRAAKPLAIEMLRMLKLPPAAYREVKTHNEAHFVRLGIGRALYAYRLAYGSLPDTLEKLVEVGIMPERYLRDENNLPLKYVREGDYMVVESPAPNGWKHRWQGLDARR